MGPWTSHCLRDSWSKFDWLRDLTCSFWLMSLHLPSTRNTMGPSQSRARANAARWKHFHIIVPGSSLFAFVPFLLHIVKPFQVLHYCSCHWNFAGLMKLEHMLSHFSLQRHTRLVHQDGPYLSILSPCCGLRTALTSRPTQSYNRGHSHWHHSLEAGEVGPRQSRSPASCGKRTLAMSFFLASLTKIPVSLAYLEVLNWTPTSQGRVSWLDL